MKIREFSTAKKWLILGAAISIVSLIVVLTNYSTAPVLMFLSIALLFIVPAFIFSGIVSIIRIIGKREHFFLRTFFGNIVLMLVFSPLLYVNRYNSGIGFLFIIIEFMLLLIHSIFFTKTGFVYGHVMKWFIERMFHVRIVPAPSSSVKTEGVPSGLAPKTRSAIGKTVAGIGAWFKKFPAFVRNNRKRLIVAGIIVGSTVVLAIGGAIIVSLITANLYANVVEASPKGYTDNRTAIRIFYSDEIAFRDPDRPGDVFEIKPSISGIAKIEGRSLIYVPDAELPDSTVYTVAVRGSLLSSPKKRFVADTSFTFNTKLMELENLSSFYVVNEETRKVESLTCEMHFSLPVDRDSLADRIAVTLDSKSLPFTIEHSEQPNIVYVSVRGFAPGERDRDIIVMIKKGITPSSGTLPLGEDVTKTITLREKDRLIVEECTTYPVSGNTYVAVRFNEPVDEVLLRRYLTISPAIEYTMFTEYRYAVLEANFAVNTNYEIFIDKGLTSKNMLTMRDDYKTNVSITDMQPNVAFTSKGKVLPLTGNLNIEFRTINLDKVRLRIEKVYKNNLIHYLRKGGEYGYEDEYSSYNSERKFLSSTDITIEGGQINEELKNLVSLKKLRESKYEGLYYISLADAKEDYNFDRMLVHVTDIGLIVKNDRKNLSAYAVNILTLASLPSVKVSLISSENQVLREAYTDANGKVVFDNYTKTEESLTPYMLLAEMSDDFTYLPVYQNLVDYSSFDTSGSSFGDELLDCFAKTERGVYRPGEDVFVTLMVRRSNLTNPETVPLIVEVNDPTGTKVTERTVRIDPDGIASFTIPTKSSNKTGEYSVIVKQDAARTIGTTSFKIEEFIPATIQATAELISYEKNNVRIRVKSRELHGAPSTGLRVDSSYRFSSRTFTSKNFDGYRFFDDTKSEFNEARVELGEGSLDENGEITYSIDVPASMFPPSALTLLFYTDVYDTSGRPVGATLSIAVNRYAAYFGIKVDGNKPFVRDGHVDIRLASVLPEDKKAKRDNITVQVRRRLWYTIFKKYGWTEKYTSERFEELVFKKTITIDGAASIAFVPDKGGEYTVSVSERSGMSSTLIFTVYDEEKDAFGDYSDPGKLGLSLDKQSYMPGETAYLSIKSAFAGRCLVSVERDRIFSSFFVECPNGKASVPIAVTEASVPNVYVTVIAFRKPMYELEHLPPVSHGAVNIQMDKSRLSQEIRVQVPQKIKAKDGLTIDCTLPGGAGSKVVLAAVDEGILMITNYRVGDPYGHFFRKRGLTVSTSTTLKDLLPDIAPYKKAFGGGEDEWARRHLNPFDARRVKSLSLYSGVLTCDAQGKIRHTFKVNEFNGTLRVMVMSAKDRRFGSEEAYVTVTDPIVLSPGIPRFLAPGDTADIPVRVFNKTGTDGTINVRLETRGPLGAVGAASTALAIKNNAESKHVFKVKAKADAGIGTIVFTGEGIGEQTKSETELSIRPACPVDSRALNGSLEPGKSATLDIRAEYIPQGKYTRLSVSQHRIARAISGLDDLFHYPHGCVEQITSQTFPMLYLADYAKYSPDFKGNRFLVDKYIASGIQGIEERLLANGSFAMWPGGDEAYPYVSDYTSHFLIEAKRLGYPVSDRMYNAIISRLGMEDVPVGRLDRRDHNRKSMVPYHLFIRALAGKPDADSMRSLYDTIKDPKQRDTISETDRILLGAAYGISGDREKAREFLPDNFEIKTFVRACFGQFDSYIRNTALYLYALTIIDPGSPAIRKLENDIINRLSSKGSFGSTQENAWALIALSSVSDTVNAGMDVDITADGKLFRKITDQTVFINEIPGEKLELTNNGTTNIYFNLFAFGTPSIPSFAETSKGIKAKRTFRDLDGNLVDMTHVKKGTQIVVTLEAGLTSQPKGKLENFVLLDLLPAGFEIENTRLESRSDMTVVPENMINAAYSDIRDDRIIVYTNEFTGNERYSYMVRAVSAGSFVIPQFHCESMYDPELFGRSGAGDRLTVVDDEQ